MRRVDIDSKNTYYRELNEKIHEAIANGAREIFLRNVNGQRYIGVGVRGNIKIWIDGVPGNDLGAFMDGPNIIALSNAQDAIGNTMNNGKIVIHGDAGDVLGYGMRGGKLFIRGDAGYRVGIHMKAYKKQIPIIIIGKTAKDFLGEYQAGGVIILLGLEIDGKPLAGNYIGTGMHGGVIYVRGDIDPFQVGSEVSIQPIEKSDEERLRVYLKEYCYEFSLSLDEVMCSKFLKLFPLYLRPYGKIYAY